DGRYGIGGLSYPSNQLWSLLVTWGLAFLASFVIILLMRSPCGRVIKSIREDEEVARALGKSVLSYKLQSLESGGVTGAPGGQTVNADTYQPQVTFFAYTILILGGAATKFGPLVGSVLFWFLFSSVSAALRDAASAGYLPSFMSSGGATGAVVLSTVGLALMLLMIFRPQGIFGDRREMTAISN